MELSGIADRHVYTKEQLIEIRDACIVSRYPIPDSVISLNSEKRILQRKSKPIVDAAVLQTKSPKSADSFYSGGVEIVSCYGGDTAQHSTGWRRTRRTSGSLPQSPLDAPSSQRHNSGSSGGEEGCGGGSSSGGNGGGAVRREFDWTLGCGKWRHRSTSGSERGAHKAAFYVSGGRGRGRGGSGSGGGGGGSEATDFHREQGGGAFTGSPGTRGRSFMRRPFQHGGQSTRGGRGGGGFKPSVPFNNHGASFSSLIHCTTDHGPTEEDFEPQDEHYKHQHPHPQPYLPHHYALHQFHKDIGLDNVSQGGEGQWNHQPASVISATAATQSPLMSSLQPTEQHKSGSSPQSSTSPSSLPQTCQAAEVAPSISESVAMALDEARVTKPAKEGFSFASNFSPRSLAESQVQAAPPPPPPLPSIPPHSSQPGSTLWYYRDPSGHVRGPYDDATMAAWFSAGYFPIQIEVRRECDKVFSRITDYIAMLGRFPFVGSSDLPPILEHHAPILAPAGSTVVAPPPPPPSIAGMVPQAPLPLPQQVNLLQTPLFQPPIALPSTAATASMPQPPQISAAAGGEPGLIDPNQVSSPQSLLFLPLSLLLKVQLAFQWYYSAFSNLASKSIFDLNSLTKATLSEMMRLQREAQRLCERVSALGMDQNLLAKSFAALSLGAVDNTAPAPTPPNIIDLQQLEAAIHRRQQEENEQLKQLQQQQQADVESVLPSPSSPIQENEDIKFEDETGKLVKAAPTPQKKQTLRKDKTVKGAQPQKTLPENEPPTTATTVAKKRKKKSRSEVVGADVEKVVEEETMTIAAGTSLEPENDWIVVPSAGATSCTPPPPPPTSQQEQNQQQQPKKSKKKRKSKPTASELHQQAWEQEEQRRRRANVERIAQAEAEAAAAAAAEEAEVTAAFAKISAAARRQQEETQLLLQQRKAREAAMREAAASLAHLKLPSTARWGAASSSSGGGAPASMADIFASQMQEEEFARAKPTPAATFASKLTAGLCGSASSTVSMPVATKSRVFVPVEAPQRSPAQSKQTASVPKTVATMNKTNVISIWDLPTDSNAIKSANSKKTKKKKANASTHLLTGPIISLAPKARAELVRWCEGQLSGFPRHNVDIPTLISLLCDIEEAEDVYLVLRFLLLSNWDRQPFFFSPTSRSYSFHPVLHYHLVLQFHHRVCVSFSVCVYLCVPFCGRHPSIIFCAPPRLSFFISYLPFVHIVAVHIGSAPLLVLFFECAHSSQLQSTI
ncbi:GRB10-interacting GYF protein 2 [Taenia solium]|eukprot:TsM_000413100 transcript=TsM_000413100 gene=TsM_000413100